MNAHNIQGESCSCEDACLCQTRAYLLCHFPGTTLREEHTPSSHSFAVVDGRGVSLRQLVMSDRLTTGDDSRVLRVLQTLAVAGHLLSHGSKPMYIEATGEFVRLRNSAGETVLRVPA